MRPESIPEVGRRPEQMSEKRISFDLRGKNAEAFRRFQEELSKELGFNVSPSKAVLWVMKKMQDMEA